MENVWRRWVLASVQFGAHSLLPCCFVHQQQPGFSTSCWSAGEQG